MEYPEPSIDDQQLLHRLRLARSISDIETCLGDADWKIAVDNGTKWQYIYPDALQAGTLVIFESSGRLEVYVMDNASSIVPGRP